MLLSPIHLSKKRNHQFNGGFTLTELLIVVLIMTIIMGVAGMSYTKSGSGQSLNTAATTLKSLIHEARTTAMGSNTFTRLLVNDDPEDENYLREVFIVSDGDNDLSTEDWVSSIRAVQLPAGVFLDCTATIDDLSGDLGTTQPEDMLTYTRDVNSTRNFTFPKSQFIQFNSKGICSLDDYELADGAAPNAGAVIGVVAGNIVNDEVVVKNQQKIAIVVWRNGTSQTVQNPNLITTGETSD